MGLYTLEKSLNYYLTPTAGDKDYLESVCGIEVTAAYDNADGAALVKPAPGQFYYEVFSSWYGVVADREELQASGLFTPQIAARVAEVEGIEELNTGHQPAARPAAQPVVQPPQPPVDALKKHEAIWGMEKQFNTANTCFFKKRKDQHKNARESGINYLEAATEFLWRWKKEG
ncbi:hypothetical protein F4813DRAFT_388458 [Daldinia decipiens]|uniref:uncharacterized protein n=1 Tax=Daldinia decipiens TaxID=326647 RepID=UPI0020C334C5|nr:uncharacterized protein F4813DRAFT_388458 [Daldinia decipiens]KAI1658692.1 hypothetical protein F4813DRAFT_388458 [Daldinia decipiens]